MTLNQLILGQGIYFLLSSLWPIIHFPSFERISGDKTDHWLVYTVALLLASSALVFISAGRSDVPVRKEVILLSVSNSLVLAFIDIYFSLKGIIRKVYLLDAVIEVLIALAVTYLVISR